MPLRYAFRMLLKNPGFAAVAVLTLAIGIGANTAIFSVINGVLLRPLPYAHPERLGVLMVRDATGDTYGYFSPINYRDLTSGLTTLAEAAAYTPTRVNLTGSGEPRRLAAARVSWNFFRVLGASPAAGRWFVEDEGRAGAASPVVISYALWQQQFGGRPDIINQEIRLDGEPRTVVGIAPAGVKAPLPVDVWLPLIFTPHELDPSQRGADWIEALVRLRSGRSFQQFNAEMAPVADRLAAAYPKNDAGWHVSAMPLHERLVGDTRPALLLLLGAVGLVLLIACVNVANLFFARGLARGRELSIRAALGASRIRLIGQLLGESVLIAIIGGGAGLLLALWGTDLLVRLGPADLPQLQSVGVDGRVLLFTLAVSIGAGLLFGVVPALHVSRPGAGGLQAPSRTVASGSRRSQRLLVAGELTLALVLLAGAGLLVRSFVALRAVSPGFAPDHVLTFQLSLPDSTYRDPAQIQSFVAQLIDRLRAEPTVRNAAAVFGLPMTDLRASSSFRYIGRPTPDTPGQEPMARFRIATPGYFGALGIPLERGRVFTAQDDMNHPGVVIINEAAARRYWPNQDPIGQHLREGINMADGKRFDDREIVGIVGNVKSDGLDVSTPPEIYVPHSQEPIDTFAVVVRTKGDPLAFAADASRAVHAVDANLPVSRVETMDQVMAASSAARRFEMALVALFAALALLLAVVGTYGVLSYAVTERTREIGVRLAIGADPRTVIGFVMRDGLRLTLLGVAAGLAGALLATRLLKHLLFAVSPADPIAFAAAAALLLLAAMAACYLPARRAARVDPVEALRNE